MGSVLKFLARAMTALNAFLITTVQEWLFVQSKSFSYEDYLTIPTGHSFIIFDPTLFTGTNLSFSPILFSAESGPVLIDFYTGTNEDGDGTPLIPSNRREGQPQPKSTLQLNPTINNLGTRFSGDSVLASGAGVGNVNSNSNVVGLPFEIDETMKKTLDINNTSGGAVIFQIKMTWFES